MTATADGERASAAAALRDGMPFAAQQDGRAAGAAGMGTVGQLQGEDPLAGVAADLFLEEASLVQMISDLQRHLAVLRAGRDSRASSNGVAQSPRALDLDLGLRSAAGPMSDLRRSPTSHSLFPAGRIIVVTHRLPQAFLSAPGAEHVKTAMDSVEQVLMDVRGMLPAECVFVGTAVDPQEAVPGALARRRALAERCRAEHGAVPAFVSSELQASAYGVFCKQMLWPLLHQLLQQGSSGSLYDRGHWQSYVEMNTALANAIADVYEEGDIVWAHGYHLFLLPEILRRRVGDSARIGIFMHSPFPSLEVFRMSPVRCELLRGLLGANVVSFNTYDDSRHFISACSRLLRVEGAVAGGCPGLVHSLSGAHRVTRVVVSPIGIGPSVPVFALDSSVDAEADEEGPGPASPARASPAPACELRGLAGLLRRRPDLKIVVGWDELDFIKGIPHKLLAFEAMLLRDAGKWRGRVLLVQVTEPSGSDGGSVGYARLRRQITEMVGRINGACATPEFSPILYLERTLSREEQASLFAHADVFLATPLRDGMNLSPHAFLLAASARRPAGSAPPAMVVSEFAGAAKSLADALRVNPWDTEGTARALEAALEMPDAERARRAAAMRGHILSHTADRWARSQIEAILAPEPTEGRLGSPGGGAPGAATGARPVPSRPGAPQDVEELAAPDGELRGLLAALAARGVPLLVCSSERPARLLEAWLGETGAALVAEHGSRGPGRGSGWREVGPPAGAARQAWMGPAAAILQTYAERTPGSSLEVQDAALVWRYGAADSDFGAWQAAEAADVLGATLANAHADVVRSERAAVTVKARGASEAAAVRALLADLREGPGVRAVVSVGGGAEWAEVEAAAAEWAAAAGVPHFPARWDRRGARRGPGPGPGRCGCGTRGPCGASSPASPT
eukprot:tig00021532_g22194.t1